MNKSNKFSPEVRERAVRLVQEHRGEYPSLWAAVESIAPKIGCVPQTLSGCAVYARQLNDSEDLIHHSDRGSQYVSIRYTERLGEAGIDPSVGSKGDSYDNALAETINGLYKAELIHRRGLLENHGIRRAGDAGMGVLVQQPEADGTTGLYPASRS